MIPKLGLIILIMGMTGCVSDRYLTAEEDAKMREICENKETGGCAVIPGATWKAIQQLFGTSI